MNRLVLSGLVAVLLGGCAHASSTKAPFETPLKWTATDIVVGPVPDGSHPVVAVKDPSIVRYKGKWHIYATTASSNGAWGMEYISFSDWKDAATAKPYFLDDNPNLRGYHCAPQVFYFTPQKKWYLVYQSQHPQYSTTDDLSKPESWSRPENFFENMPSAGLDYWVICDDTHAYLFCTGDNGKMYRSRTKIEDFPHGFSNPEVALEGSRDGVFEGGMTYKIKGANAYRTAHNPPSKELLDVCDRLGMLVMDETRHFNASPKYLKYLEWLVRRDRNHPSVILWSLFNEEGLEVNEEGMEMTRTMNALVKRLDTTRPTAGGQNKGQSGRDGKANPQANPQNAAWTLDVVGINYQASDYDKILAAYPDKPVISTEDTSQMMTRGEYTTDHSRNIVAAYDDVCPGWDKISSARNSWEAIATRPRIAGGFSWTGFDYRGEPTPYGWPSASSFFGAMALGGFPKTEFHVRQAHWVKSKPVLTLVPHWNWPGRECQPIKVMALANCDTVKLTLNGESLGEKPVDQFQMVSWDVPYAPRRSIVGT